MDVQDGFWGNSAVVSGRLGDNAFILFHWHSATKFQEDTSENNAFQYLTFFFLYTKKLQFSKFAFLVM